MTAPAGFWTRRKAAVAAEEQAEAAARDARERQAQEDALAERPDAELLAEAGMPEPEELVSTEQVQAFLKSALPQRLKTRALRRLWRLNPALANLDGLLEYGEDYTDSANVVENLQTAYQVGKGMFDKFATPDAAPPEEVAEAEAEATDDPADTPDDTAQADTAQADPAQEAAQDPPAPYIHTYAETGDTEDTDAPEPASAPARRMRFRFETEEGNA